MQNQARSTVVMVLMLAMLPLCAMADDTYYLSAGARISVFGNLAAGRDTSVGYNHSGEWGIELRNISMDSAWYGSNTALSVAWLKGLGGDNIRWSAGAGMGDASSAAVDGQAYILVIGRAEFSVFYLDIENMVFRDGYMGDYYLGLNWYFIKSAVSAGINFYLGSMLGAGSGYIGVFPDAGLGIKAVF